LRRRFQGIVRGLFLEGVCLHRATRRFTTRFLNCFSRTKSGPPFCCPRQQNLNIDGVVVVHNGYVVAEKYYSPYKQDTPHDTYSITKSVVSALVGIAIQEGYIDSVDDSILDYFPERTFENDDALKRSITLEHLLTMSSGLECF